MKRQRQGRRLPWILLPVVLLLACGVRKSSTDAPAQDPPATAFDEATAGCVRGQVLWDGAPPIVKPFAVRFNPDSSPVLREQRLRDNPNVPVIDPATRGIARAVVFLRGVDPAKARPWDLPAVSVEMRDRQFHVIQGKSDARAGFVRCGDTIDMVSKEVVCHSLHAGGAAFFTLSFPDPEQPLSRPLTQPGLVELTSAAGFFWMRSYLFVVEHPYYTLTDAQGRYELPQVPPGEYEIVAWLPSWQPIEQDRDPETSFLWRLRFGPPLEQTQTVKLGNRETRDVQLCISH